MPFQDYSATPASNTTIGDTPGTFIGPNMPRDNVRPALQQLAADGRELYDTVIAAGAGGALPAFIAAGTGAVERTALAKMRETTPTPQDYGASGDGTGDDQPEIQAAVDSLGAFGGALDLPVATYRIGASGGAGITMTAPVSIQGRGGGYTAINPAALGASDDALVLRADPGYIFENLVLSGFAIHNPTNGTRAGRYGIWLDTQAAHPVGLRKLTMANVQIGAGTDYAVYHLNNATNNTNGGMYGCTFRDCTFNGGMKFENSGDSNSVLESIISGANIGVNVTLVSGASVFRVVGCNITNSGGIFKLTNGSRFHFTGNNCENYTAGAAATNDSALINITGADGVIYGGVISGNLISGFGTTTATTLVKLQNCRGTLIDNNVFLSGAVGLTVGIEVGNTCQDVRIGRNVFNAGVTTKITDNGQGTMGVIKTATLANSWVAKSGSDETLQFIKDPSSGMVTLWGSITSGTSTNGTTITTLPAGFRPPKVVRSNMTALNAGTPVAGELAIATDGTCTITYVNGSQELHVNVTFPADNIGNAVSAE